MSDRPRVIVALPDAVEGGVVADWIAGEGFVPIRKADAKAAAEEMQARPFALLITDAACAFRDGLHRLSRGRNPSTPTIVIGDEAAARQYDAVGTAMHVARPAERATLVCLMSMALLDGRPVRRSTRKFVRKFAALINGAPAHILDISNEGVRLEMPRDHLGAPPPVFTVRIPLIGVGVVVRRMWLKAETVDGRPGATCCGGALASNPLKAEQGWRAFVDAIDTVPVGSMTSVDV